MATAPPDEAIKRNPIPRDLGDIPLLIDAQGIANLGGVSLSTVRRAIDRGDIPSHKVGPRAVRIRREHALAWLGLLVD